MDIVVVGGQCLSGELTPSGAKNAAVALIPASLLCEGEVIFTNVPSITDVERQVALLRRLGSTVEWDKSQHVLRLNHAGFDPSGLEVLDLADLRLESMRGTALFWGPIVARFGKVVFRTAPIGCALGERSLEAHFDVLRTMGVSVLVDDNGITLESRESREQVTSWMIEMSPTATENALMFAVGKTGTTVLINAASEPNVQDLCHFLIKAGAQIEGVGSNRLTIRGGRRLAGVTHRILSDHYEIVTFLTMAAITGGGLRIHDALPEHFGHIRYVLEQFGIECGYEGDLLVLPSEQKLRIRSTDARLTIKCMPWPGFPVDMLPLLVPLALAVPHGQVLIHNWMYEHGLEWVGQLGIMGADIVSGGAHRVLINGGRPLRGAELVAPNIIRAVIAMVMAGMIASGKTRIHHADPMNRGHPHFISNLKRLGGQVEVV